MDMSRSWKTALLLAVGILPCITQAQTRKTKKQAAEKQQSRDVLSKDAGGTPKVLTVTSAFKPSLRNPAKINFTAATPVIDSSRLPLTYQVPVQNLFFAYQPVPVKPLALSIDTSVNWESRQFIKAGFGNYTTPYLEAGFSFGDGVHSMVALHAHYTSSTGDLPFQQFGKTGAEALGIFNTTNNNEVTGRLTFENSLQYKYGITGPATAFTKEQLEQQFNSLGLELGLKNKMPNSFGMTYHPELRLFYFNDNRNAQEVSFAGSLDINKRFGRLFAFDLAGTADISSLSRPGTVSTIANNLYFIDPSIQFNSPNFKLNLGIQPSWDNHVFSVLPNFTGEVKITDERFVLQAGWIGYFNKNTYRSLAAFNPWIEQPSTLLNTKISEQYAGFKGSLGKHFTYNARLSFLKITNQPLFTNDTAAGNSQTFRILYEPTLQAVRLHGEVVYTDQEKLSLTAGISYTHYTMQQQYNQAFGLLPLELTGSLRYRVLKDLHIKADAFVWDGTYYQGKSQQALKVDPAMDLNIGGDYTILSHLNLWLQFNNVLNNHYQRWHQYDVLGFNVVGGVVYSFGK